MELIAHRGASFDAPENSLEAFELAVGQGAQRLELDIQCTADGVPVVNHDENTSRTGDRNLEIQFATEAQVRAVRLSNGEPIPRFEDVCRTFSGRCELDVELKATNASVARSILEIMKRHDILEHALITSFDPSVLRVMRQHGFKGRTGLVVGSLSLHPRQRAYELWPLKAWRSAQATDLVMHHRLLHPMLSRTIRSEGGQVIVWMSMDDESQDERTRAALYQRIRRIAPDGAIVGRVEEAARHLLSCPPSNGDAQSDDKATG